MERVIEERNMKRKFSVGFFIGLFAVLSFSKLASANSFTSSSAFQAAIAGYSIHTANFDSDDPTSTQSPH